MFTEKFDRFACIGDSITCEVEGYELTATLHEDNDSGAPWEKEDGHGPVSEWTSRAKEPGERVLCEDSGGFRYYDVQEATRLAKRDGWDTPPYKQGTPGERAARAVEADFRALRGWCRDEWGYCSVVLTISEDGDEIDDHAASVVGVDVNHPNGDNGYLTEVANELLSQVSDTVKDMAQDRVDAEREADLLENGPKCQNCYNHHLRLPEVCLLGAIGGVLVARGYAEEDVLAVINGGIDADDFWNEMRNVLDWVEDRVAERAQVE
jgi:hypothetical protein